MAKIVYEEWHPQGAILRMIDHSNTIIDSYAAQGYDLTVRQLYYRIIGLDLFPEDRRWRQIEDTKKWVRDPQGTKNAPPNYKWLGGFISKGRMAGMIDWNSIVDRTRSMDENAHWTSAQEILDNAAAGFALNKWAGQPHLPFVMCEKEALSGILHPVCKENDIPFSANRGYSSSSHLYQVAMKLRRLQDAGQTPVILYFGDHDPSGLDMDRDVWERISKLGDFSLEVTRLALTMEQIEKLQPPPNPTKITDSRADAYIQQYGVESWELDALDPAMLAQIAKDAILSWRDDEAWNALLEEENEIKAQLREFAEQKRKIEKKFTRR